MKLMNHSKKTKSITWGITLKIIPIIGNNLLCGIFQKSIKRLKIG